MNWWPIIKLMHVIYNDATMKIKQRNNKEKHEKQPQMHLKLLFYHFKGGCDDKAHAESMQRGTNTIQMTIYH